MSLSSADFSQNHIFRSSFRNTIKVQTVRIQIKAYIQSGLPRPIPLNSVESDQGCTSRIFFDNAGDNVTLTLYNVALVSQKPC